MLKQNFCEFGPLTNLTENEFSLTLVSPSQNKCHFTCPLENPNTYAKFPRCLISLLIFLDDFFVMFQEIFSFWSHRSLAHVLMNYRFRREQFAAPILDIHCSLRWHTVRTKNTLRGMSTAIAMTTTERTQGYVFSTNFFIYSYSGEILVLVLTQE